MNATTHPCAPEEVMALVDSELSPERAQSVSTHIGQCAECSSLAADLGGLSDKIATWQVEPIPARLSAQVKSALAGRTAEAVLSPGGLAKLRFRALRRTLQFAAVFAGLLALVALSVPNLLRSRMAANEASAVGALRILNTAAVTYYGRYRHYPTSLASFGSSASGIVTEDAAGLVDEGLARGRKSGYRFTYQSTPPGGSENRASYTIHADPIEPGKGGQRHFFTDQTGAILIRGPGSGGPAQAETLNAEDQDTTRREKTTSTVVETPPLIARTATLKIVVEKIGDARLGLDRILGQHRGYVAQLSASAESDSTATLIASVRVPADQLDACIGELKRLGRVEVESQAGEEVTQQHSDLMARLKNSRNTEDRLRQVIQQHAAQVKDILDVEKESARVRGEIEQLEAQQQTLEHRVNFATIELKLAEQYQAQLTSPAPSVAMQLRNATVNGFRSASEHLLSVILFFAESGPTFLLWLLVLFLPARKLWRRYQRALASGYSFGG
jgi:hypothetical protein